MFLEYATSDKTIVNKLKIKKLMEFWELIWHYQQKTLYQNCLDFCMHIFSCISSSTMYNFYPILRRKCTDSPFTILSPWCNVVYYYYCEWKLPRPSFFILSKVYASSPSAIDNKAFLISPPTPTPATSQRKNNFVLRSCFSGVAFWIMEINDKILKGLARNTNAACLYRGGLRNAR